MAIADAVSITIPSHPRFLSLVREIVVKWCKIKDMGDEEAEKIKLAVDEACSNVIKHAYRSDESGIIKVKFSATSSAFRVTIEDAGLKVEQSSLQGRSLDDVRPGGLGIHLITRAFDSMTYDRRKRKGNRLILTRHAKRTA
jgi:anti-sigma regulatory factor (Ser/Thr protein kinase)